jgi:hypothetical protein
VFQTQLDQQRRHSPLTVRVKSERTQPIDGTVYCGQSLEIFLRSPDHGVGYISSYSCRSCRRSFRYVLSQLVTFPAEDTRQCNWEDTADHPILLSWSLSCIQPSLCWTAKVLRVLAVREKTHLGTRADNNRKEYEGFGLGPFFVNAGPQPFLVIRDPEHIEKVLKASQEVTPAAARVEVFDKLFGAPQAALDLYAGKGASDKHRDALKYAHITVTQKHLSGIPLSNNVEKYMSILSGNLNDKMFQVGSWTQIEDVWSFLRQVITRCSLVSLFGTDLLKQYSGVVKDYWEFADAIEGFIPGLPRYWVPGEAAKVQERLHQGIEKWLKANHSGSEFARIADEDPLWDDFRGSKFIQERDDVLAKIEGMDMRARAAEILSIMHE